MKLIKQVCLHFQSGKSDKVYEVDLCEVAAEQFVVNFRYGRRGANLRDGTKTALPVGRGEAERVFEALVAAKTKKGYLPAGGAQVPEPAPAARSTDGGGRDQAVLAALRGGGTDDWPLARVAWRAGELELAAAEPLLIDALSRARDPLLQYSLAWALGRCGGPSSVAPLRRIAEGGATEAARRIATEALRLVSDDERRRIAAEATNRLPGDPAELAAQLSAEPATASDRLLPLYRIDTPAVRRGLLRALEGVELDGATFAAVRALFKAAELRRDPEVFGVLARRFELTRGRPFLWHASRPAFSTATRDYLRRRVWRTLRRLGRDRSPDYVRMAVGVLLPFTDADAQPVRRGISSIWVGGEISLHWDRFAGYWAFNHILYGNSSRYRSDRRGRAFRCADGVEPGAPPPATREESFPELWDASPAALLHLLDESRCLPVHEMAVRALRANRTFLEALDLEALVMLLASAYPITAELGFEVAAARHDPAAPDPALIRAVAGCNHPPGREAARRWIAACHERLAADSALWASLVASRFADNRQFVLGHLRGRRIEPEVARLIIGRVVAAVKELDDEARAREAGDVLLELFRRELATIGEPVIRDLLGAPSLAVQELAARILLGHETLGEKPPDDLLLGLLGSEHASIQAIGARLLGQLSDTDLLARTGLVIELATHERAEIRDAIRPALLRLVEADAELARALAADFARKLLHKNDKGVPADVVALFRGALGAHAGDIDKELVLSLLRARSPHAQELGGLLLSATLDADDLSLAEIIDLASHDILEVRRGARAMCEGNLDRLRLAMNGAVRLLDAKWEDTRAWARELFADRFSERELTPEVLVGICDSVRPEVQRFGQELIARHFDREHGAEYLLKLSEHPGEAMQRFATSYLEGHAAGRPERLATLEPFFVRVLSRVNKGRIAKLRIIELLAAEARGSREAAEVAARVFGRASATMAVTQKEPMIAAMVEIRRRHPDIELPLRITPAEIRRAAEVTGGV